MPEQPMTVKYALTWAYDYARPWATCLADAFKKERARREAAEKVVEAIKNKEKHEDCEYETRVRHLTKGIKVCVSYQRDLDKALEAYDKAREG